MNLQLPYRRLRDLFKRRFARPKPELRIVVIQRDPSLLRLEEWRSTPDLVKIGQKFLSNPEFRLMLDVCRNEHLAKFVLPLESGSEARSVFLGRIEGYMMFANNLELMASFQRPTEELHATFEPPEHAEIKT